LLDRTLIRALHQVFSTLLALAVAVHQVGRLSGIQSIWVFMMPVMAPWRSGDDHTMPSLQAAKSCNSWTLECDAGMQPGNDVLGYAPRLITP
jgi:hypothetical protein